jgi:hypothetical protein
VDWSIAYSRPFSRPYPFTGCGTANRRGPCVIYLCTYTVVGGLQRDVVY